MAATTTDRLLLTVEEAAERLGIGKTLAWELVWDGVLPSVRLGRCVRIPLRALEDWIAQTATGGQR
jgi:excisionase family DNA binding protein